MSKPRWNKLIAAMVAFLGVGLTVGFVAYLAEPGTTAVETPVSRVGLFVLLAVSLSFVVLSYFLFRGRDWARRVLLVVTLLAGCGLAITGISSVFAIGTSLLSAISQLGICLAIIPIPFIAFLCLRHPDVARDFNDSTP